MTLFTDKYWALMTLQQAEMVYLKRENNRLEEKILINQSNIQIYLLALVIIVLCFFHYFN
jgi:hypothetical protein